MADSAPQQTFVFYCPPFKEDVGGIIALYKLCHLLNKLGYRSVIWPFAKPTWRDFSQRSCWGKLLRYPFRLARLKQRHSSPFPSPMAGYSDLKDAIVVYPEIVRGNPLGAERVVRWFLNKPGRVAGPGRDRDPVNYGSDELYFFFHKDFDDPSLHSESGNLLRILDFRRDVYQQRNTGERSGTCYMVRKGSDRKLDQHPADAVLVDGFSHEEMADIFNRCEYFISYDLYTMYSAYASVCGCHSIVVPEEGLSLEDWRSDEVLRYGIAYGREQVAWAEKTRPKLIERLIQQENDSEDMARNFARICQQRFQTGAAPAATEKA